MIVQSVARRIKQSNRLAVRGVGPLLDNAIVVDTLVLLHEAMVQAIQDENISLIFEPHIFTYDPKGLKLMWYKNGVDGHVILFFPSAYTEEIGSLFYRKGEQEAQCEVSAANLLFYLDIVFREYFGG